MIWLLLLLTGCIEDPGERALPAGDPIAFEVDVQPVLAASCANPACHGAVERPLQTYAVRLHRLDPADLYLDAPLTSEELRRNQRSAEAMLSGFAAAADSPLLTKPLAPEQGGSTHTGGVQFHDPTEPGYRALTAWADDALRNLESP